MPAGGILIGWALSDLLVKVLTGVFGPRPASPAVPGAHLGPTALAALIAVPAAALNGTRRARRPPSRNCATREPARDNRRVYPDGPGRARRARAAWPSS
ncbi:hypothetical protein [Streptomyces sp. S1D4-23]|uniref:hypothetical protein n=1 Tax=Streptomyces sp. S1D4-23 TaxID=2594463 RepID=UPI001164F268|nr:hypothetical protein [Streptomyces sp. S1D4-23]QDO06424.1 hypothetical protein FNV68_09430 [Streptomyces sp. S1D4-23]